MELITTKPKAYDIVKSCDINPEPNHNKIEYVNSELVDRVHQKLKDEYGMKVARNFDCAVENSGTLTEFLDTLYTLESNKWELRRTINF